MTIARQQLFQIQDLDAPMFVAALSWEEALAKWRDFVADKNRIAADDVEGPRGILLVCKASQLLL